MRHSISERLSRLETPASERRGQFSATNPVPLIEVNVELFGARHGEADRWRPM